MDFRPPGALSPELGRRLGIKASELIPRDNPEDSKFLGSVWEKTYVVVDLETTGLSATDQITEIGAVKVRGQKVVEQFNTLVNPGVEIPPRITALTGITDSMVEDAPTPGEAIAAFLEFAELENSILIAHNASFDTGFLIRGAEAADLKWPKPTVIDTLALARTILPRPLISNHRLATLVKYFGVVNPSSHRALADATVTADVFAGLVNRLDEAGATDFADLFVAAQPVPYRHRKKVALAKDLPAEPGVYRFLSADGLTLYVGSATNLRSRVRSYFSASEKRRRIHAMLDQVDSLKVEVTSTPLEARVRELHAIAGERPLFNSASRHQEDTAWLVLENGFLRVVHTITPQQAPSALGPYRRVTHALKAREAILLTLGQDPMVLADLPVGDVGVDNEELATLCLQGRGHKVSETLLAIMSELSTQSQYEFAARIRDYFSYYLQGIERQRDTALIARARKIVWAHHIHRGGWQIHAASRGKLLAAIKTPPRTSPAPQVAELTSLEALPESGVHLPYSTWEEVRLLTRSLNEPGARMIQWESDDPWAWPIDSDLSELERFANLPSPKRGRS